MSRFPVPFAPIAYRYHLAILCFMIHEIKDLMYEVYLSL